MMTRNPDRRFLLHHTHEGRIGLCACDDPVPPDPAQVIATLTFDQTIGLLDDIDQTLTDCIWRDGGPPDSD